MNSESESNICRKENIFLENIEIIQETSIEKPNFAASRKRS